MVSEGKPAVCTKDGNDTACTMMHRTKHHCTTTYVVCGTHQAHSESKFKLHKDICWLLTSCESDRDSPRQCCSCRKHDCSCLITLNCCGARKSEKSRCAQSGARRLTLPLNSSNHVGSHWIDDRWRAYVRPGGYMPNSASQSCTAHLRSCLAGRCCILLVYLAAVCSCCCTFVLANYRTCGLKMLLQQLLSQTSSRAR
jgi:hypothetical protein